MYKKSISLLAAAMLASAAAMAQEVTSLAEWTFQNVHDAEETAEGTIYTPTETPYDDNTTVTGWFNTITPLVLPDQYTGEQKNYVITGYSESRYWQFCTGYQTRVFRIENTVSNETVTDYSDPAQHKVYYEVDFSTKGYKGISLELAIAPGNNVQTPVQAVVSTDGGATWAGAGTINTSSTWYTYETATLTISANNKESVKVRLLPTVGTTNWNLSFIKIFAAE
ncbi:MAG: hypothetical protein J1E29_05765 [Duncaniella sp.]|nr:hypothetical protein [Duncaniella sp.]